MKLSIEVDTEKSPNLIGELLKQNFFNDDDEINHGVELLPDEPLEWGEEFPYHAATFNGIKARWFWDGDMTLQFIFQDGSVLENGDAKKDYGWSYYDAEHWKLEVSCRNDGLDI